MTELRVLADYPYWCYVSDLVLYFAFWFNLAGCLYFIGRLLKKLNNRNESKRRMDRGATKGKETYGYDDLTR